MVFVTESGSTYEIVENKVRRLRGLNDPTPRIGKDGQWREFIKISPITKGHPVFIVWKDDIQPSSELGKVPGTQTSRVVKIIENFN